MSKLTDEQLLEELQQRIEEKNMLLAEQKQFVADLKMVNDKLLQSEKLKSQFLSNIKNEINNPMTSIMGLLKLTLSKSDDPSAVQKNTQLVFREASILNFQLQNIFMAAELEAGEIQVQLGSFSCRKVVKEAFDMIQNQNGEKINCDIVIQEDQMIQSDRYKILVVLSNLIDNAYKFRNHHKHQIKVELSDLNDNISLTVKDDGVGISKEDRAKIYDRFNQLEIGTTKNYGGHGLGLSIVHSLIDALDGTLKIESEQNGGTQVEIVLPKINEDSGTKLFEDEGFDLFFEDENEQTF